MRVLFSLCLLVAIFPTVSINVFRKSSVLDATDLGTSEQAQGCPAACSGNGDCVSGTCYCYKGFGGSDCSQRACPNGCSAHGACDVATGRCACADNYALQPDCSEAVCPESSAGLICSGKGSCNATARACACFAGWGGKGCELPTCPGRTDAGADCSGHGVCEIVSNATARCICEKPWYGSDCGTKQCDPKCKDIGHGSCINGECVCNAAWRGPNCESPVCPGALRRQRVRTVDKVSMSSSDYFVYAPIPSATPSASPIVLSAEQEAANMQQAFSAMSLLQVAEEDEGQQQSAEELRAVMRSLLAKIEKWPLKQPDSKQPRFAAAHSEQQQATAAEAVTAAQALLTMRASLDAQFKATLDADPLDAEAVTVYCSGRGICGIDGLCSCGLGWSGIDCSLPICPGASANSTLACSGHGDCIVNRTASVYDSSAACVCTVGWSGPACADRLCPANCTSAINGACNATSGFCQCKPGFKGADCSEQVCPGDNGVNGGCYGRGKCGAAQPGQCKCDEGYYGPACEYLQCMAPAGVLNKNASSVAGGNGTVAARILNGGTGLDVPVLAPNVAPSFLELEPAWNETLANSVIDRLRWLNPEHADIQGALQMPSHLLYTPCGGEEHGLCRNGQCYCSPSWTGTACHIRTCRNACSNRGVCIHGSCFCAAGWGGALGDCSERVVYHGRLLAAAASPSPSSTASLSATPSPARSVEAPSSTSVSVAAAVSSAGTPAVTQQPSPSPAQPRFAAGANSALLSSYAAPELSTAISSLESIARSARFGDESLPHYDHGPSRNLHGYRSTIFMEMDEEVTNTTTSKISKGDAVAINVTGARSTVFIPVLFIPGISPSGQISSAEPLSPGSNIDVQLRVAVPTVKTQGSATSAIENATDVVCDLGWAGVDCSIPVPVCNGIAGSTDARLAVAFGKVGITMNVSVDGCGKHGSCTFRGCNCEPGWLGAFCQLQIPRFECPVARNPAEIYDITGEVRGQNNTLSGLEMIMRQFMPSTSATPSSSVAPSPSVVAANSSSSSPIAPVVVSASNGSAPVAEAASASLQTTPSPLGAGPARFREVFSADGENQNEYADPGNEGIFNVAIFGSAPHNGPPKSGASLHGDHVSDDTRFLAAGAQTMADIKNAAVQSVASELSASAMLTSSVSAEDRLQSILEKVKANAAKATEEYEHKRWQAQLHKDLNSESASTNALDYNSASDDQLLAAAFLELQLHNDQVDQVRFRSERGSKSQLALSADDPEDASAPPPPSSSATPSTSMTPSITSTPSVTPTPSTTSTATPTPSTTSTASASRTPSPTPTCTPTPSVTPSASYLPVMYRMGYGAGMVCGGRGACVPDWEEAAAHMLATEITHVPASATDNVTNDVKVTDLEREHKVKELLAQLAAQSSAASWPYDLTAEAGLADAIGVAAAIKEAGALSAGNGGDDRSVGDGSTPLMRVLESLQLKGVCRCLEGFRGPACEERFVEPKHGACDVRTGACSCFAVSEEDKPAYVGQRWTGPSCAKRTCEKDCSGHGICNGDTGTCACFAGWAGSNCAQTSCINECNFHGRCTLMESANNITSNINSTVVITKAVCQCDRGWGGADCGKRICPNECSGNGLCTENAQCFCKDGWVGDDCSVSIKSGVGAVLVNTTDERQTACGGCGGPNRGLCVNGQCFCNPGYSGVHCESQQCPHQCSGHGVCNVNTGDCTCLPGWTAADCNSAEGASSNAGNHTATAASATAAAQPSAAAGASTSPLAAPATY